MIGTVENCETKEKFVPITLANGMVCHISQKDSGPKKNELCIMIAHPVNRVTVFTIVTSKESMYGAQYIMETAAKQFGDEMILGDVKSVLRVKKGICKVSEKLESDIKLTHRFPVDDDLSWGKTTFTVGDWNQIIDVLNLL